jgi:hypothetical protein
MTLTAEHAQLPDGPSLADQPTPTSSNRAIVASVAAVVAVVTAALLSVAVLTEDRTTSIGTGRTVAANGSISAIDHRDQTAMHHQAPARTVAENGSISAIDHRDEASTD